jgi:hypothetical protein
MEEVMRSMLSMVLLGSLVAGAPVVAVADSVVKEGKGLDRVYVGQPADDALKSLGTPKDNLHDLYLVYELEGGVILKYRVDDGRLATLSFKGEPGAPYKTARGATFGSSIDAVRKLYGKPDLEVADKLFYLRQGVSFFFDADKCYEIKVFAKE